MCSTYPIMRLPLLHTFYLDYFARLFIAYANLYFRANIIFRETTRP